MLKFATPRLLMVMLAVLSTFADTDNINELYDAIESRDLNKVKDLLTHESFMYKFEYYSPNTLLHLAADRPWVDMMIWLLSKGADPNERNWQGSTPLHTAVKSNCVECVEVLIDNDVNVNAVNADGDTVLQIALWNCDEDMMKLLIMKNADASVLFKRNAKTYAADICHIYNLNELVND